MVRPAASSAVASIFYLLQATAVELHVPVLSGAAVFVAVQHVRGVLAVVPVHIFVEGGGDLGGGLGLLVVIVVFTGCAFAF